MSEKKRAKAFMVLGTGSGVGKSFVTAGLCRILSNQGLRVAPFKAQNMSNNSFVTREGGEMGRAQAVQAQCARVEPSFHMNPVLLKPSADNYSQVVVHGKALGSFKACEYYSLGGKIWEAIRESYDRLSREFEILVIEGAGSPAEINLKDFDLVNFRVARLADAECILVGDIDRGGVFAWLWGTLALLAQGERDRIIGLVINKFRGDIKLLEPGLQMLEALSHKKVLGVLPYALDLWIEEEDAVALEGRGGSLCPPDQGQPQGVAPTVDIAVILLPRISNATDFQILAREPGVSVRMIRRLEEFGRPDLLILPGTKAAQADLEYLKEKGFAKKIGDYVHSGGKVLGICGGFQMLGETVEDPEGVESGLSAISGLGLLPLRTRFFPEKTLKQIQGRLRGRIFSCPIECEIEGYEIHMGQTEIQGGAGALFEICEEGSGAGWRPEGASDPSGRIAGTYLHGLFDNAGFRSSFLNALRESLRKGGLSNSCHAARIRPTGPHSSTALVKEENYDKLAKLLYENIDLGFLEPCLNSSSPSA